MYPTNIYAEFPGISKEMDARAWISFRFGLKLNSRRDHDVYGMFADRPTIETVCSAFTIFFPECSEALAEISGGTCNAW